MNAGSFLESIRNAAPRVHCIANYVTANDCANLLLAVGASPIMADDPMESAQITAHCAALTLSMGTPGPRRLEAMQRSAQAAKQRGIPVLLDPVGVTLSLFRRETAQQLLDGGGIGIIRANASEIRVLAGEETESCGLEAADDPAYAADTAVSLARRYGAVVAMTGETDVVTDGTRLCRIFGGHPIQRSVTGAGCQLTALLGAFAAVGQDDLFGAAVSGVCMMGLCGQLAAQRMSAQDGNAACRGYIIDAAYRMTAEMLTKGVG